MASDFCGEYVGIEGVTRLSPNCDDFLSIGNLDNYPESRCEVCYEEAAANPNDKTSVYNNNCLYPINSINNACNNLLESGKIADSNLYYSIEFNSLQEYLDILPKIKTVTINANSVTNLPGYLFYDSGRVSKSNGDNVIESLFPIEGIDDSVGLKSEDNFVIVSDSGLLLLEVTQSSGFVGPDRVTEYTFSVYSNWINSGRYYDYCASKDIVDDGLRKYGKYCEFVDDPKCDCLNKNTVTDILYPNVNLATKETLKETAQCVYVECTGKGDTFLLKDG